MKKPWRTSRTRPELIGVRLSTTELAELQAAASTEGITVATLLRLRGLQQAQHDQLRALVEALLAALDRFDISVPHEDWHTAVAGVRRHLDGDTT